jgi:hypothetical protein
VGLQGRLNAAAAEAVNLGLRKVKGLTAKAPAAKLASQQRSELVDLLCQLQRYYQGAGRAARPGLLQVAELC